MAHDLAPLAPLYAFLAVAIVALAAFHLYVGPSELHRSHILLGRHLLFGEAVDVPTHPMAGYALLIAALGPWTIAFNSVLGLVAFMSVCRALDLQAMRPGPLLYGAALAFAAVVSSWNDHAPWISLVLLATAVAHICGTRSWRSGAAIGLLLGLAYNVRSEAMLYFAILTVLTVALDRRVHRTWNLAHHGAAVAVFAAAMVPWAIYSTATIGKYAPAATNGGAVAYYGFGLVPANRYGIVQKDEYVAERARSIGEASPWSSRSNDYFRKAYRDLVIVDPGFFAQRIAWGLATALALGPHPPDIVEAVAETSSDRERIEAAKHRIKAAVGMAPSSPAIDAGDVRRPAPTPLDMAAVLMTAALYWTLKLTMIVVLARLAMLLFQPQRLMSAGPIAAHAVSALIAAVLVSALILPSARTNTVVVVLGALLLQRVACRGQRQSMRERAAALLGWPTAARFSPNPVPRPMRRGGKP